MHIPFVKTVRVIGGTLGIVLALLPAVAGIGMLFVDFGNTWLRAGIALFMCGVTIRRVAFNRQMRHRLPAEWTFRSALIASLAGSCLCAVGSIVFGGAIGWVGAFVSVRLLLGYAWVLHQFTERPATP
jgi:hypothetical protein